MYTSMVTRPSKVLSNAFRIVRRGTSLVNLQDDILKWFPSPLDNSACRLCSTQAQDKHIPYSTAKTFAQTKKEQNWCYDPTIKHESLRQCAVPLYAYCDDSATDWSDSSGSETETEILTVEEAQTREKDKILAQAKKEKPFAHQPHVNYEELKQIKYVDSPDSFTSPPSDSELDTPEDAEARQKRYIRAVGYGRSYVPLRYKHLNETQEEIQTHLDKYPEGTKDEEFFRYNPDINYEPLKRYIVPRFAFFDSSSTDWSSSSDAECETEAVAEKEAQIQEDKIPAGSKEAPLFGDDLIKSPAADLQSAAR